MGRSHRILLIDRAGTSRPSFTNPLEDKGYTVDRFTSVGEALASGDLPKAEVAVLDAASMKTSGVRMAGQLKTQLNLTPLILVAPNGAGVSPNGTIEAVLVQPFTPRKLLNRVARLLPAEACDEVCLGPIRLDRLRRVVRCGGKRTRLTPKLTHLLLLFIDKEGRLIRREELMRQVWHTDYTGDMRTVDVHVSWLRRAIEPDPAAPRYLKTVRGMGYRLDLSRLRGVPAE